jgi:hypothetical protein
VAIPSAPLREGPDRMVPGTARVRGLGDDGPSLREKDRGGCLAASTGASTRRGAAGSPFEVLMDRQGAPSQHTTTA